MFHSFSLSLEAALRTEERETVNARLILKDCFFLFLVHSTDLVP